jgi:[acyl-carrier-protein] S-malonyltransferase
MTVAILCSGQGAQHRAMFDLTAGLPSTQPVFAAASATLDGRDPRVLVRTAGDEEIHSDRVGQILCCTQALAAWSAIQLAVGSDVVIAGYSVGELASWGCAGLLGVNRVAELARTRAELMDEVAGASTGLAGIRGLSRAVLESICSRHGADIAIINSRDSFVVGAGRDRLVPLCDEATKSGAQRAVVLPVAIASHTPRLAPAARRFREALAAAAPPPSTRPRMRLLSGIDGNLVLDVGRGVDKLAAQISRTIDWAACLEACGELAVDKVLELGPGHALTTMAREAIPGADCHSLEDFKTIPGVLSWLGR